MLDQALTLKDKGNKLFKCEKYEDAIVVYTEALSLKYPVAKEKAVFYKNRAACYLKLNNLQQAVNDASEALNLEPRDTKALFRRCQAYEQLGQFEDAFRDATLLLSLDSKNSAVQPILERLNPFIQSKVGKQLSTSSKVCEMFNFAMNEPGIEAEKRRQACKNLIVLAKEDAGANEILKYGGIPRILDFLSDEDEFFRLNGTRLLSCLAHNCVERSRKIINSIDIKQLHVMIGCDDEGLSGAACHLLQDLILGLCDVERIRKEREKYEAERLNEPGNRVKPFPFVAEKIDKEVMSIVDSLMRPIPRLICSRKVSRYGRENLLELVVKIIGSKEGIGWSTSWVDIDGVQSLLQVAGTITEHKEVKLLPQSRMTASLALAQIYDDLIGEKKRNLFKEKADEYFTEVLADRTMASKLEAVLALSALLQGPFEVGNHILGREGILEMMLAMINSADPLHTKCAVEALVHSASKKDRCSGVINEATPLLKRLYQSDNDAVKVRALVGLCKLGSFGGGDASAKSFADGSTRSLARSCRKFLCNPEKDADLRKWAAEGLAFLTLDAEVKDDLTKDSSSLRSLIDLAKLRDKAILYPVSTIFVNLSNSYETKEVDPELLELAKFSKQHVPEEHELDKEPHVSERRRQLVKEGVVSAVVLFSQQESVSENSREQLARILLACAHEPEDRGTVVAQGGSKTLVGLATTQNTSAGKVQAALALAKIGITMDPALAFPGQRSCEIVRPLLALLHCDRKALENYEALLALTNLASMNDSVRRRILKESGVQKVEHYCFEEHDMLRRAATECLCNLIMLDEIAQTFLCKNDRLKMLLLFCGEEDVGLVRAASGGIAMLSHDPKVGRKLTECSQQWCDILSVLVVSEEIDLQHRGCYIVMHMMADEDVARKVVESSLLEVMMAISKVDQAERNSAKECATEALALAQRHKLIKAI